MRRCEGCYVGFSGEWCDNCDQWPCVCPPDLALMTPEDFPRWKDRDCPHEEDARIPDEGGEVCGDCGVVMIKWR